MIITIRDKKNIDYVFENVEYYEKRNNLFIMVFPDYSLQFFELNKIFLYEVIE